MKKVIFVGAGEYAESVYDSMAKEEYDLIGFVDEYKKGYHMGKPILAATIEEVFNFRDYAYFISIGDFSQMESFPESKHDDMVDASSDAFNELTDSTFDIDALL